MRLTPEGVDALAAAYASGTMRGGARRRFEALAREHPELREAVQRWQQTLAVMTELAPAVAPPPQVWARIDAQLRADMAWRRDAPSSSTGPVQPGPAAPQLGSGPGPATEVSGRGEGWRAWPGWLGAALGAVALGAAVMAGMAQQRAGALQQQLTAQTALLAQARTELAAVSRIGQVAVLSDGKSDAVLLVSYDGSREQLVVRRVGAYREADEKSLQLWALADGSAPRSLGVLGREQRLQLAAPVASVQPAQLMAVSLEPLGGVPSERGPTGPVLFKGAVLPL